jgi:hypothetical protein
LSGTRAAAGRRRLRNRLAGHTLRFARFLLAPPGAPISGDNIRQFCRGVDIGSPGNQG